MNNKTIGMFAHVDAGKTTLAEQLLYHTNSIRQRGRVDHKDAFLDSHDIEKERGITVFADQAVFRYGDTVYHLIDTPGHVDFSSEMERAIRVMDAAVVVVSAVEGVQGHTETVWQLLRKHGVPTFFFINKIDRVGADVGRVLDEIRRNLTPDAYDITEWETGAGGIPEEFAAFLAERDESLLALYMAGELGASSWGEAMEHMARECLWFPCLCGSALQDVGVRELLGHLDRLTQGTRYSSEGEFAGRVYKLRHDENGTRLTFLKLLQGKLRVRDEVSYGEGSGQEKEREKVTQIRVYNGSKYKIVEMAEAGELVAVTGLTAAAVGDGLGLLEEKAAFELMPTLKAKVMFAPPLHPKDVLRSFRLLGAEDPALNVLWDERLQEIHIHVMGTIQLEVLEQLVKERFGQKVGFGPPEILYKETIGSPVGGCGHFEPLGHYAEVHVLLEPGEPGSGIRFANACHPDVLPVQFQHLVRQHVFEREHPGLLTGSPLTDVTVTLLKGRAHNKHTSGGDFREAAFRAIRQGLEKADNLLLEPVYAFKIRTESEHMGRILSDIQQAHGRFDPPELSEDGGSLLVTGTAPVATFMNYSMELASFTRGKGSIQLLFGGYDRCHNAQQVIERKSYDKNADPASTSASIFCAKGQAYPVPWDRAEAEMHV